MRERRVHELHERHVHAWLVGYHELHLRYRCANCHHLKRTSKTEAVKRGREQLQHQRTYPQQDSDRQRRQHAGHQAAKRRSRGRVGRE